MDTPPSSPSLDSEIESSKLPHNSPASLGALPPELVMQITEFLNDSALTNLSIACADLHILADPEMKNRAKKHALGATNLYERNFRYADNATPGIDLPITIVDRSDPNACTRYLPGWDERLGRMVFEGNLDAVRVLLSTGGTANSYTSSGAWMLSLAVLSRRPDMVRLLLEHGANPSSQDLILKLSPLAYAARAMHDEMVSMLVSAGGDLAEYDVLNNIVASCSVETVRMALARGAPVDVCGYGGETALHCAARREDPVVLDLVLARVAPRTIDAMSDSGDTALHLATRNHDATSARRLVDAGASIARRNNLGYSPLHYALIHRHFQIAADLIHRGAPLNVVNHRGESELHLAVEVSAAGIVRLLLGRNVNVNARGTSPVTGLATPLHYAVRRRCPEMVDILLNESPVRPDLTLTDENGRTPRETAELLGEAEIVEMLTVDDT